MNFQIIRAALLIGLAAILSTNGDVVLVGIAAIIAAYGGTVWTKGWDKQSRMIAISQLDAPSLAVIERTKGLIYDGTGIDGALLRHLLATGLIKTEIFPSTPISYGYYLTEEGRSLLTKNLGQKIYPEILCDLLRIRYWEGYPSDFSKKKDGFRKRYKVSWDEAWEVLGRLLKQEIKDQKDTVELFNSFVSRNSFETVMNEIVDSWLKAIKENS
jgi:hypothetical protein